MGADVGLPNPPIQKSSNDLLYRLVRAGHIER